jgi:hypothetical protein
MTVMYFHFAALGRFPIERRKHAITVPMYADCMIVLAYLIPLSLNEESSRLVVSTCDLTSDGQLDAPPATAFTTSSP